MHWWDEGQHVAVARAAAQDHQDIDDSLVDQLKTIYIVATQLGCYDAADWILRKLHESEDKAERQHSF